MDALHVSDDNGSYTATATDKGEAGLMNTLSEPFGDDLIEIRQDKGTGNRPVSYVSWSRYAERLNQVLGFCWEFDVEIIDMDGDGVTVLASMTVHRDGQSVTRKQFGNWSTAMLSQGNAIKAASSDALKRCAGLFGVGLHLYFDEHEGGQDYQPQGGQGQDRGGQGNRHAKNDNAPATENQLKYLEGLGNKETTPPNVKQEIENALNSGAVSKQFASDLIQKAKAQGGQGGQDRGGQGQDRGGQGNRQPTRQDEPPPHGDGDLPF